MLPIAKLPLHTTMNERLVMGGHFTTADTGAPTSPGGDGLPYRTGVGTFRVVVPRGITGFDSLVAHACTPGGSTDQIANRIVFDASGGHITIEVWDISGGAVAETTGVRVDWFGLAHRRI